MALVIKKKGCKKVNTSHRPIIEETVSEALEKSNVETSPIGPHEEKRYLDKVYVPASNNPRQIVKNAFADNNFSTDARKEKDEEDRDESDRVEVSDVVEVEDVESSGDHKYGQNCYNIRTDRTNSKEGHQLLQIPPTEKKKWPQKPCIYCRKYGTRRDTRHSCSLCNVALCKDPCFSEYHSCK